jgi:CRISPR-associated protein Csb1
MTNRKMFEVHMRPAIGTRFQPTGFPDLGSAEFDRPVINKDGEPDWEKALLVESAQSMANRLEQMAWDDATNRPIELFEALPYVQVIDEASGDYLTSSRTESHRLASAFIKDSTLDGQEMVEVIKGRLGLEDDRPVPPRDIALAILALDPFCLIHGVFFADTRWPSQPKITRALTAFIEALDVRQADSGGVKKDHVRHSLGDHSGGGTAEGYGSVPFHRVEWTAREIVASFALDLRQFRSYGLSEPVTDLLEAIALWEIRSLVEEGLRLRTACDLVPSDDLDDLALPPLADLESRIRAGIDSLPADIDPSPIEVLWVGGKKRKK